MHAAAASAADLSDPAAMADARRGFIAAPKGQVLDDAGGVVWDHDAFDFVRGPAPPTVHPSLWRQALLDHNKGLFKVRDGIWQLRGFDLANITLIQGRTGWIVVDALTSRETAAAALAFARQHLGPQAVSALIYTHSHVDHFGGALGVLSPSEARTRAVPVVAPAGFLEEATSENVLMGTAMGRRAGAMYGSRLPRSAVGLVDNGLGQAVALGRIGLLPPTVTVNQPDQPMVLDGVRFVFHNVPGTEAPAELTFELPELKAYCGAELMSHTLHNLYTLRGAKVRDAARWAAFLDAALPHTAQAEVVFNQHHWPVWGQPAIHDFIVRQRDIYQFIHDQTVRGMNAGLTASEIAEGLQLPSALQDHLSVHGYYGTVRHNVKAVFQHYLGWFDAHPANLDPLPPSEAARRYVALAGGLAPMVAQAQKAFDAGDLRWAAELLKHAVYAEPGDRSARELLARTFEQLGYASEASTWRNVYLNGALELRQGPPALGLRRDLALDLLQHTPIEHFLQAMAASLNAEKAGDRRITINLVFTDLDSPSGHWVLRLSSGVLHLSREAPIADADATLSLTQAFFLRMVTGQAGAGQMLLSGDVHVSGSVIELGRFLSMLDKPAGNFPIVTR
jgi:alkyl sulfatase BDS1-like metallo-beta-lactamase superfamily hydrolase